jgi:hypothetical protein
MPKLYPIILNNLKITAMKNLKIYMIAALVFLAVPFTEAQHRDDTDDEMVTLLGNSNHIGGYGAFSMKYFQMDKRDGVMFGGRGGVIVGHGISFGSVGNGFLTQPVYDPILGEDAMIVGGYGGIYIEPILLPRFPVHIALPMTFGGGGLGYTINRHNDNHWDNWDDDYTKGRGFLIFEPGVEVEFNVMRHFRFAVGASYRLTSNMELRYNTGNSLIVPRDAMNGFSAGVTFKFGVF